jgi:hypothetical protein
MIEAVIQLRLWFFPRVEAKFKKQVKHKAGGTTSTLPHPSLALTLAAFNPTDKLIKKLYRFSKPEGT